MSISGVGAGNSPAVQAMLNLQNQLDQLSQELGTNQKSSSYSGLGSQSGVTIGLDAQLAAINGYSNTISTVNTTLGIAQSSLTQLGTLAGTVEQEFTDQPGFNLPGNFEDLLDGIALLQSMLDTYVPLRRLHVAEVHPERCVILIGIAPS